MFSPVNSLQSQKVGLGMHAQWVIACVPSPTFDTSVRMASYLNCTPVDFSCSTNHQIYNFQNKPKVWPCRGLSNLHDLISLTPFNSLLLSEEISEKCNFLADFSSYPPRSAYLIRHTHAHVSSPYYSSVASSRSVMSWYTLSCRGLCCTSNLVHWTVGLEYILLWSPPEEYI